MDTVSEIDVDGPSSTIDEFRLEEKWSRATFFKMKRRGLAPATYRIPGTNIVRISARAIREWRARMEALAQGEAAAQENARRSEHARHAGKIAAKSPRHVSKKRRKK